MARRSLAMEAIFGGMKDLTVAQECARAILIFFYGLGMLRLSGRRTFAQMSAIDLIISIVVGSNLSRAMTGGAPLWGTMAAVAVLICLHLLLAFAVSRSPGLANWVEGGPILLARNGVMDDRARRKCKISIPDMEESLREHGLDGLKDIGGTSKIILEPSGKISVIKPGQGTTS